MSYLRGVARVGKSVELGRYRGGGPQAIMVDVRGQRDVLMTFKRLKGGAEKVVATDIDAKIFQEDTAYNGDGSTLDFTGQDLNATPVAPRTLEVICTGQPNIEDVLGDGTLVFQGQPRLLAASGTFATMAGESMQVRTEDGVIQTITFGTEATIGAAVATLNAQLKGAEAVAQGAQDVDLLSLGTGLNLNGGEQEGGGQLGGNPEYASIEVLAENFDSAITTKLGISPGIETTLAGTINYTTGALVLNYPGQAPATGDIFANYIDTQLLAGGSQNVLRLPNLSELENLVIYGLSQGPGESLVNLQIDPIRIGSAGGA